MHQQIMQENISTRSGRYTKEKGTSSQKGIYYEQDVTAFISLRALNNVEDFCIISNPSNCAPFDDIILCTRADERNVIYLFQVKSKENREPIRDEEFSGVATRKIKTQDKFNIINLYEKYSSSINFIKNLIPPFYSEKCEFKVIIFTNRPMQVNSEIFEELSGDPIFSTNNGGVYKFNEEFINKYSKKYTQHKVTDIKRQRLQEGDNAMDFFLQSINVFTKQCDISDTSVADIKNLFKAEDNIALKIKVEYFRCVKNWWELDTEKEYLTKEFIYKIFLYSALKPFGVCLDNYRKNEYEKFLEIFQRNSVEEKNDGNHANKYNFDDSSDSDEEHNKSYTVGRRECLDLLWKSIKNNNLSINSKHLQFVLGKTLEDFDDFKGVQHFDDLFFYYERIVSEGDLDPLSKNQIQYYVGCLLGELPFIIENVGLLLTKEHLQCAKIVFVEPIKEDFGENLLNLDENALDLLKKQIITTKSGQHFFIADIIKDKSSISDVLSLIIDTRNENRIKKEVFVDRRIQNVELDETIFLEKNQSKLENDVFIITGCFDEFSEYFGVNSNNVHRLEVEDESHCYLESSTIEPFLIESFNDNKVKIRFNKNIFIANENVNINTAKTGNYHFIKLFDLGERKFIIAWLKTNGNVENIKRFTVNKLCWAIKEEKILFDTHYSCNCCIKLKAFSNYLQQNQFVIISGTPGIGKTTFMKQFSLTARTNDFISLVTLRDHYDYFEKSEKNFTSSIAHLLYFCKDESTILKDFIENKINRGEIIILFDGFDEVAPRFTDIVSKIINQIREEHFKIILTTRSVLKEKVENLFGTFAMTLTPFNRDDQEQFCVNYFAQNIDCNVDYSKYRPIITRNIKNDRECFRLPLNIHILSELIFNEIRNGIHFDKFYQFNQLEFYQKFIDCKLEIYKKFEKNFDKTMIERYHKYFSIRMLFDKLPKYKNIENTLNIKLDDYIDYLKAGGEKVGFLIGDINEIFIHRTVAEYFSAKWLYDVFVPSDNLKLITGEKEFAQCIMEIINVSMKYGDDSINLNFPVVRLFFDLMINQNELHRGAVKGDYRYVEQILKTDISKVKTVNYFNRNLLFTIISSEYFFKRNYILNISYEWLDVLKLLIINFKDVLIKKDNSEINILDHVKQIKSNKPPLKIIIHNNLLYVNRPFQLWEIFRLENLYNCNIDELIEILKLPETKFSLMFNAVKNHHESVLVKFSSSGVNMDIKYGNSNLHLLHFATEEGSLDFIISRSSFGIKENINLLDKMGRSLMHYAVASGKRELITYLKENQIDFRSYDKFGLSPFHYAIILNKIDLVKYFLDDLDVNFPNEYGWLPIQYAAAFCNMEIFQLLLKKGADMNCKSVGGVTLIHLLTFINSEINDLIGSYVENGKRERNIINQFSNDQRTYNKNCIDFVKFLIEKGCDINSKLDDITPLIIAVAMGNLKFVEIFIESFPELIYDYKILNIAVSNYVTDIKHIGILTLLLKNNIDVKLLDDNMNSVLHYALSKRKVCFEAIEILIKNGANPIIPNDAGITPLHFAIQEKEIKTAKLFIDHIDEIGINVKTFEGNTPLHYAVYYNCFEIAKYLIGKKADVNLANEENLTPFDIASGGEIILSLKRYNAKLNRTPADLASRRNIISYLKRNNAKSNGIIYDKPYHISSFKIDISFRRDDHFKKFIPDFYCFMQDYLVINS